MFGGFGRSLVASRLSFVSTLACDRDIAGALGLQSSVLPARGIREIGKKQMKLNDMTPEMDVDPETYEVRANGELLTCEPAEELPMAQRYFLF
tara:strand:+ start:44 stop:322 length:279 start_codon:yes stop_codon:yes gene_type:complete